ncbi:hypothetical protein [Altererythrobacter lutimaris]|uniref:Uncharacterized protein n=1 Tax=Altererythrobacter lutimaris TaxID=2743979 RepID=A0A850HBC5_9SPHN|nr:hypothetical protein [Altererythrobacter lutimaris]NVE94301.1 hypothetical protein [Altererythrobacter lutimaris]
MSEETDNRGEKGLLWAISLYIAVEFAFRLWKVRAESEIFEFFFIPMPTWALGVQGAVCILVAGKGLLAVRKLPDSYQPWEKVLYFLVGVAFAVVGVLSLILMPDQTQLLAEGKK